MKNMSKRLLSLLLVLLLVVSALPVMAFAEGEDAAWTETTLAEIKSTDIVAIVMHGSVTDTDYVMLNNGGTETYGPAAVWDASKTEDATMQWNVVAVEGGYELYPAGTTETWLYCTAANNGLRVGNTEAAAVWSLDETTGYLKCQDTKDATRYLGVYDNNGGAAVEKPNFRTYTNTTGNTKNQTITFYKLTGGGEQEETIIWTETTLAEVQSTDVVAIVMHGSVTDTDYVMLNNGGTETYGPAAVWDASKTEDATMQWNVVAVEGGYELYPVGTTETWLYCTAANNGLRVGNAEAAAVWSLDEATGYLKCQDTKDATRYLGVYDNNGGAAVEKPNFRTYTNTTGNTKNQTITFYKLAVGTAPAPDPGPTPDPDPEEPTVVTIAEALAGETNAEFTVKGVVTLVDGKNIYIQDATGAIDLYFSAAPTDISLGDTLIASGKRADYNGLPELTGATYEKSSGLTLTAKETTIGALASADICSYVKLTGVEITEVYDNNGSYSNPNITVKDAEGNSIQLYKAVINKDTEGNWEYEVGDIIDVHAAVGVYKTTTLQLRNTVASEISLTPKTQYAKLSDTIADGDQLVIYYNRDSLVMTNTVSGKGLAGTAATPEGDFIQVTEDMAVLTASVADGHVTFTNAEGKFLTSGATGNSLTFADASSDYSLWDIKAVTGGKHIVNTNAVYNGNAQALEIYNGVFTTFTEKDTDYYLFNLYKLTDEEPVVTDGRPADGSQVVIYNASEDGHVIGLEDDLGASMSAVSATIEDGVAYVENGGRVFTVSVDGSDYVFASNGKYLASNDAEELFLTETLDDYAKWNLEEKNDSYVMYNKVAKYTFSGGSSSKVCIEYFSGAFSGWTYKSSDSGLFEFNFYPVAEGTTITEGLVNKPAVAFGALPDAYVGADYTFSFTVETLFGLDGVVTVTANGDVLTANEDGSYTIPAEKITAELSTIVIAVSGQDVKGVVFSSETSVPVKDEPVISDLTPKAGTETGENKRPVISAKISNAGENPTVTMTVNGETVNAEYGGGTITFIPTSDLADGRTTVVVTVVRADGKEASKSWSFTVGEATYQLYFGQLHSHTTYSDGSGSLDDALAYVAGLPESANVDFVSFTDHSNYFDSSSAANPEGALYDMSLASEASQALWNTYKGTVAAFNESQSDIVAIAGFEMTWSGGPGHINTFNTPGIVSRNNTTLNNKTDDAGMKAYYALLCQEEGADSLSQFNHPGTTFGTFSDFAYWDALIDSRMYMVEVGNGEGAIGAGGYYPSYEYYTMALDKGWHVAPTNNQDNHKGKWGNANDARDVILTDNFSEEGIYDAISQYRMYATEDKNLEIEYTVNDLMMGSIIPTDEIPEKLQINVTVNDPDISDSISKVEVIVNSGRVAYTWNDPAELATGSLSVELAPDYSYYFIRVTEGDGDLAVTAPVWVGESLKLGISSVECGTATPVTGEELTLTTTLFNSELTAATVKSITYTSGTEVLGEQTNVEPVPASGTLAVNYNYTPTVAKVMTVKVTVVLELDGKEYTFTKDIELDVLDADSLVYVGIDASHHNEYVAGNYKDSMGNFGNLAAGYSVRTVQLNTSEDLISACANEKYKMIVLTAPSRRNGTALRDPYDTYSDDEIAALVAFNANGGAIVLCGWGDFYESYSSFPAEDHMAAQQNKILAALGSSLRISDDETKDNTWNGGQAQRLYLSTYNFDSFLLEGVDFDAEYPHNNMYTELYSQYGGASIYAVDADGNASSTVPATVTPVVYGFDTTYSSDDDSDNRGGVGEIPMYEIAEGDSRLMVMATEQLPGQGLIVVSGAAFLSNFEVQATISDSGSEKNYSNYKICENLVQYINPVQVTDIAVVQAQTEVGYKYTIEGVVTSNASGYDKDTAFFDCIYVQDETAGICCFPVAGNYKVGDVVRITGTTDFYQGEAELQVTSIQKIGEADPVEPTVVTAQEINDGSVLGSLITLTGTVESFELENGLVQTIMVKDENGDVARVFIDGYITTSEDVQNLEVGCNITVTGLASYDNTFNAPEGPFPRIRIRDRADVVCTAAEEPVNPPVVDPDPIQPGKPSGSGSCTTTTPSEEKLPFYDVRTSDWFYDDVKYVYENGIMNGTGVNKFDPEANLTRGMIVTILYRLEGEPSVRFENTFGDVADGLWYSDPVEWAAKNGIVTGYTNGDFGPTDPITREQLAAILYRYAQYKGYDVSVGEDTNILSYTDAFDVSEYAIPAMQWACGEGLINGSNGKLMPKANASRAQVAAIIHRFLEK